MDKKNKNRIKLTDKALSKFENKMAGEYSLAYSKMRKAIINAISLYGVDGNMSNTAYQYDRFNKLTKEIYASMALIKANKPQSVSSYLKDQYFFNYYYSAFTVESNWQQKLGVKQFKRTDIEPLSTMSKVSLKQNVEVVRGNLQRALTQSISQGEGVGLTSKRLKNVLEKNLNDSLRIARTETTATMNDANLQLMQKANKKLGIKKQWVSTLDGKTRDRHKRLDGEVVDIDKPFSNGLMYPGDMSGPPGEVINCRCAMREIVEGYSNSAQYRRARGVDGKNEIIPYKTYEEWAKERL